MEAYLDNAATTKVFDSVKDIMVKTLCEDYGNPSSLHRKGLNAETYIKNGKEIIAKSLKVTPGEIIFTSGGTESNNLALIGTAFANKRAGNHIITTNIEHPSVYSVMEFLEEQGFRITFAPVDHYGRIMIDELLEKVNQDTILVSTMYVNNEIGVIQDISEISKRIKEKNPNILLHVDGIQGYGKIPIYPKREGIDLFSLSGHKIHGPKGIGALYVRDKVKIKPIIFGGGQERGIRSGTENIPGIAGIGQAVEETFKNNEEKRKTLYELKEQFIKGVSKIEGTVVNEIPDSMQKMAPHIVSVSFKGIRSEVLLHALEEKQVYVSSGSACSSNHPAVSKTLKAVGIKKELLDSTLRFSFSAQTTSAEIEFALSSLLELVPILRKYQPR
jgi:cysteine desulfurase